MRNILVQIENLVFQFVKYFQRIVYISVTVGWPKCWWEIYLSKLKIYFSNWWNIFNISCLCLSQLVGSTADVKTLPNGFFHISQSATSDFFWIFLYLMGFQLLLISHLFLHKQITKTGNWIEKYQFWGFHQSLGFDKTFIVGLCCCIWAITSQRNVLYTVWPLTKDKKAFN